MTSRPTCSRTCFDRTAQRDGIWAWDSTLGEAVLVIPWVLALLGDNPMQSEFACHMGMQAKLFCRNCWVKGRDAKEDASTPRARAHGEESDGASTDASVEGSDESVSDCSRQSMDSPSDVEGDSEDAASPAMVKGPGLKKSKKNVAESMSSMLDRVKAFVKVISPDLALICKLTSSHRSAVFLGQRQRLQRSSSHTLTSLPCLTTSPRSMTSGQHQASRIRFSCSISRHSLPPTRGREDTRRNKRRWTRR